LASPFSGTAFPQKFFTVKALKNLPAHQFATLTNLDLVLIIILSPVFSAADKILTFSQLFWGSLILIGTFIVINFHSQ
jgi:hypothetical protein